MKIVIIGGHFSPALALMQALSKNNQVLCIARKHGLEGDSAVSLEYQAISKLGFEFKTITTGRLQRKFTKHTLPSLLKIPIGTRQAYKILKDFNPDVVVGFGSYLSVPIIISAKLLKIPVIIHEQTLEAGAANKFLASFAEKICVSWPSSLGFFPESKTILTGNPIREEIIKAKELRKEEDKKDMHTILVSGGSLGSHAINVLIEKNLSNILEVSRIIHQTGDARRYKDFERLEEIKKGLPENLKERYQIEKHFDPGEFGQLLKNADIIVARAGINTVSEIIFLEKPALFIPLPFSQRQEQEKNAGFARELGIAEILEDQHNQNEFLQILLKMIKNIKDYKVKKQDNISIDATEKIIEIIKSVKK